MERWHKVIRLDVRLSVSGLLFQIKGHPEDLHDVVVYIDPVAACFLLLVQLVNKYPQYYLN